MTVLTTALPAHASSLALGYPGSAVYGQTFTVPAGVTALSAFTFRLASSVAGERVSFVARVLAWDEAEQRPLAPVLWSSEPTGLAVDPLTGEAHPWMQALTFAPDGGLSVTPGTRLVALIDASASALANSDAPGTLAMDVGPNAGGGAFVHRAAVEAPEGLTLGVWSVSDLTAAHFEAVFSG